MEKERLEFIDIAKGLGIFCVVSGHLMGEGGITFVGSMKLRELIYSFHMPLFFLISGILLRNSLGEESYSTGFVIRRVKKAVQTLLIPYFLWSIIYYIVSDKNGNQNLVDWIPYVITFRGVAPLWFLAALFLSELTVFLILFITKRHWEQIIILVLLLFFAGKCSVLKSNCEDCSVWERFLFITFGRNFACSFFVLFGWVFADFFIMAKDWKTDLFLVSSVVLLFGVFDTMWGGVNLHLLSWRKNISFFVFGIAGSTVVMVLSKRLEQIELECKIRRFHDLLKKLGRNSLGIMLLHYPPFPFMRYSVSVCNLWKLEGIIQFVFALVFVFFVCDTAVSLMKNGKLL